jgi:hypothetical protein
MLLLSILLYLITSLIVCLVVFQSVNFSKAVISFFISAFSINVLTGEVLSLAGLLNRGWAFLLFQLTLCAAICAALIFRLKPDLLGLLKQSLAEKNPLKGIDTLLLVLICVVLAALFYVGIKTPPNNLDSLHTHLLRIYYWLQHGSLANWHATGIPQLNYPVNAHLQGLWLFLLGKSETLFFLVSWFSLAVIACVVFEIARMLKFSVTQALFSVILLLTCAVILLQVYSFQNDLAVAAMVMVAGWALLNYARQKRLADLVLVMLALALSLGIKQTAFLVLPFFFIAALILLIKKQVNKNHLKWLPLLVVFFLIFSFYQYAQNLSFFHSFFGKEVVSSDKPLSFFEQIEKFRYNTPRSLIEFVNFDGVEKTLEDTLLNYKSTFFEEIFLRSKIDLQSNRYFLKGIDPGEMFSYSKNRDLSEDTSGYGPLFFVLTPISLLIVFLQKGRERKRYAVLALLYFALYFVLIVLQRPGWDPYQGRYFILGVAPFFPLLGVCLPTRRFFRQAVLLVLLLASVYISFNVVSLNNSKPIITASTITNWQNKFLGDVPGQSGMTTFMKRGLRYLSYQLYQNAIERPSIFESSYYEQLYYFETSTLPDITLVNDTIPQGEPIYLMMSRDPLEYGLFGVNRSRSLYPVDLPNEVPLNGYMLIQNTRKVTLTDFRHVNSNEHYSVVHKEK